MKMLGVKFHLLNLLGFVSGLFISLFMFIRYFFIVRDIDRLIIYTIVGFVLSFIFYIHNYIRNFDEDKEFIHDRLDALYSDTEKSLKKVGEKTDLLQQKIENINLELKTFQKIQKN